MTHQNDLTPEEQELLAQATLAEWVKAIIELIVDLSFWNGIAASFAEGMARGFNKHR